SRSACARRPSTRTTARRTSGERKPRRCSRHCEEPKATKQSRYGTHDQAKKDCFASLAMTTTIPSPLPRQKPLHRRPPCGLRVVRLRHEMTVVAEPRQQRVVGLAAGRTPRRSHRAGETRGKIAVVLGVGPPAR